MAAFPLRICSTLPTVNPPSFARPLLPSTAGCAWVVVVWGSAKCAFWESWCSAPRRAVTRGTTENLSISSTPSGAQADITGLDVPTACVTPCAVLVKRNADITITVNKEGYEPQIIPLTKEIPGTGAAAFAGNILAGGLFGMGADAVTGAAQDHKPNPVIVTLQPIERLPPRAPRPARPRPVKPLPLPAAGT
jgi:hypothetical protein